MSQNYQYTVRNMIEELSRLHPDTVVQIAILGVDGTEQIRSVLSIISLSEVIDSQDVRLIDSIRDIDNLVHGSGSEEAMKPVSRNELFQYHTDAIKKVLPESGNTSDIAVYIVSEVSTRVPTESEKEISESV